MTTKERIDKLEGDIDTLLLLQNPKYRVWTDGKIYKLQRKQRFGWCWLDACWAWDNWYGKIRPHKFESKKEIYNFIKDGKESEWNLLK